MRIRPAGHEDVPAINEIVERAYGVYVDRIGMRPGPMEDDYGERVRAGHAFVGEEDGEVVGLLVLVEEPDHLLIENVAVNPGRQGEGIGRELLAFAEDRARESGRDTLRLFTHEQMTENLDLYARLGYVETERRRESGFARVFMSKRL